MENNNQNGIQNDKQNKMNDLVCEIYDEIEYLTYINSIYNETNNLYEKMNLLRDLIDKNNKCNKKN